ncbi:MAG: cytochrome c3 family protein [Rubrobacteridae bacterium]|nr:cytochrome c3 family protein [Rubrobacteridae bacterium]
MKKLFYVVFIAIMNLIVFAGISLAATPSVISPTDGSSLWRYQDSHDTTEKAEGAYLAYNTANGKYETNPHGGYDSSTNKCKICHAVHRAEGAYYLLRADTQDDACNYCHIGGSAFSDTTVYTLNPAGTATPNGHTIGAGTGSNGYMRIGPLALRCMSCHQQHGAKNMVWRPNDITSGTQLANGYKLLRSSPSASIQGSATETVEGVEYTVNYDEGMQNYTAYEQYDPASGKFLVSSNNIVKVPEANMSAANTGPGHTIYTAFTGITDPAKQRGPDNDPQTVNQYALSPWCADCHNLDIGYWKGLTNEELGFKSHSDRTHPVPYQGAWRGPGQCYSCHRNDMPDKGTTTVAYNWFSFHSAGSVGTSCLNCHDLHGGMGGSLLPAEGNCQECHFGTISYRKYNDDIDGAGTRSDFPHSGGNDSIKLLGPSTKRMNSNGTFSYGTGVTENNIDGVCLRCHSGVGANH